ncbi:MAG: DUF4197 domain-containing protein [Porphyrobacter sp.]|jgi:hypothetical protein|nr:DUF4197 domain-containing protein [Porphyrobacter sp.]
MIGQREDYPTRRTILTSAGASALLLALPGCAGVGGPLSMEEAIRRLLLLSAENAFARLTMPGGYWDEQIARAGLGNMLGARGDVLTRILTSALVKSRLEEEFARVAVDASFRAAPIVTDAVRLIGIRNAVDLVRGGPSAASTFLRGEVGDRLLDAMVPGLGEGLRIARDPVLSEAVRALTGVDTRAAATRLGQTIDNAIWDEIGREEAAIRANPRATRDPLLIGVFGLGQ